jgi:hypothetical protein
MHLFKTCFLALLIFPFAQNLDAQDCKYEVEDIDKFAKTKKLITKSTVLWNPGNGNSFTMKGKLESNQRALLCRYVFNKPYTIAQGAQIVFLFEDGEVLTLITQGESVAKSEKEKLLYNSTFTLVLNEEQYAMLAEKAITDIRITAKERNFDRPIKKEHSKRVADLLSCLK